MLLWFRGSQGLGGEGLQIQLEAAEVHMLSFSSAVMVVDVLFDEARQRWFGGTEEILIEVTLRLDLAVRKEIYGWSRRGGGVSWCEGRRIQRTKNRYFSVF